MRIKNIEKQHCNIAAYSIKNLNFFLFAYLREIFTLIYIYHVITKTKTKTKVLYSLRNRVCYNCLFSLFLLKSPRNNMIRNTRATERARNLNFVYLLKKERKKKINIELVRSEIIRNYAMLQYIHLFLP